MFFDPAFADDLFPARKRSGHAYSKMRYLSAQLEAYLAGGLWLELAAHANAMARRLAGGLAEHPDIALLAPVEANLVFLDMPGSACSSASAPRGSRSMPRAAAPRSGWSRATPQPRTKSTGWSRRPWSRTVMRCLIHVAVRAEPSGEESRLAIGIWPERMSMPRIATGITVPGRLRRSDRRPEGDPGANERSTAGILYGVRNRGYSRSA